MGHSVQLAVTSPSASMRYPTSFENEVLTVTVSRILYEVNPGMVNQDTHFDPTEAEHRLSTVRVDRNALSAELQRLSRGPFRDLLADFLTCAPTAKDIQRAAMKSPDRWAQALAIVAKLSGYHERLEVEGVAKVATLSDVEIEEKLNAIIEKRAQQLAAQRAQEHLPPPPDGGSVEGRSECVGMDVQERS